MNWFQRHLNWTYVLAQLFAVGVLVAAEGEVVGGGARITGLAMLPVSGWVIIQKGRSLWWLLLSGVGSPLWLTSSGTSLYQKRSWKMPAIFVTLNSLLFLALLGSLIGLLILYVTVYHSAEPYVLPYVLLWAYTFWVYGVFLPAFFIVGIALLIWGKFFNVSVLNKLLPFTAIPVIVIPDLLLPERIRAAGLLAGVSIAAVLCVFVIATTVKNLTWQRGKKGSGNA